MASEAVNQTAGQSIDDIVDSKSLAPIVEFNDTKSRVEELTKNLSEDELYTLEEQLVNKEAHKEVQSHVCLPLGLGCILGSILSYGTSAGEFSDKIYSAVVLLAAIPIFAYSWYSGKRAKNLNLTRYFVQEKRYALREARYAQKS